MTDRATKILLSIIAAGLWANLFVIQIHTARAANDYGNVLQNIETELSSIQVGTCANKKIC